MYQKWSKSNHVTKTSLQNFKWVNPDSCSNSQRHHFGHRLINKLTKATRKAESRCPWTHRYENNLAADFSTNCTTEETTPPTGRRQCYKPRCERRGSNTSCAGDAGQRGTSEGSTDPKPKATASASITLDPTQIPNVIFNTLADFGKFEVGNEEHGFVREILKGGNQI